MIFLIPRNIYLVILFVVASLAGVSNLWAQGKEAIPEKAIARQVAALSEKIRAIRQLGYTDEAELDHELTGLFQQELSGKTAHILLDTFLLWSNDLYVNNLNESAIVLVNCARGLAARVDNDTMLVLFTLFRGLLYVDEYKIDSARMMLEQAMTKCQEKHISEEFAEPYSLRGILAFHDFKLQEALGYFTKARKLYEKRGEARNMAGVDVNIGMIHSRLRDYPKAIQYFKSGVDYYESVGLNAPLCLTLNNLGVNYKKADSLQLAMETISQAIGIAKRLGDEVQLAQLYLNMGNVQRMRREYAGAGVLLDSSLLISERLGLGFGIMLFHLNKGELLLATGKPVEALAMLLKAREMANRYQDPMVELEINRLLSLAYEENGQDKLALRHYKNYASLNDSLKRAESKQLITELEQLYAEVLNKKNVAELKQRMEAASYRNKLLILVSLGSIVLLLSVLAWMYNKRKAEGLQHLLLEEEQERLNMLVEIKDRELASKTMHSAALNELGFSLSKKMKRLLPGMSKEKAAEFSLIIRELESKLTGDNWKDLEARFLQVHDDLYDKLLAICPDFTPTELKICSFLRLNLSSKEIAVLTNRSVTTIVNTRSAIRKKLNLPNDENLTSFMVAL